MTEETIEAILDDNSEWIEYAGQLIGSDKFNSISKQLLEQHEAEMILFKEWCEEKETAIRIDYYLTKKTYLTTTDLLTLFKNRNKYRL